MNRQEKADLLASIVNARRAHRVEEYDFSLWIDLLGKQIATELKEEIEQPPVKITSPAERDTEIYNRYRALRNYCGVEEAQEKLCAQGFDADDVHRISIKGPRKNSLKTGGVCTPDAD